MLLFSCYIKLQFDVLQILDYASFKIYAFRKQSLINTVLHLIFCKKFLPSDVVILFDDKFGLQLTLVC